MFAGVVGEIESVISPSGINRHAHGIENLYQFGRSDTERLVDLGLENLECAGGVAFRFVNRRGKLVGEGQKVVDALVDDRQVCAEETERLELAEEVRQGPQRSDDVLEAEVGKIRQGAEADRKSVGE